MQLAPKQDRRWYGDRHDEPFVLTRTLLEEAMLAQVSLRRSEVTRSDAFPTLTTELRVQSRIASGGSGDMMTLELGHTHLKPMLTVPAYHSLRPRTLSRRMPCASMRMSELFWSVARSQTCKIHGRHYRSVPFKGVHCSHLKPYGLLSCTRLPLRAQRRLFNSTIAADGLAVHDRFSGARHRLHCRCALVQ